MILCDYFKSNFAIQVNLFISHVIIYLYNSVLMSYLNVLYYLFFFFFSKGTSNYENSKKQEW